MYPGGEMKHLLLIMALALPLYAEDGPCKADREKFCKGKKPGEGLFKCMKENRDKVSAPCREMMDKRADNKPHPCESDRQKYCPDKEWGKGLFECMVANEKKLSETCKAAKRAEDANKKKGKG